MTRLISFLVCVALSGCVMPSPKPPPNAKPFHSPAAVLFYGYGGATFSGGLNTTAQSLRDAGFDARVYDYTNWPQAEADLEAGNPGKIVIVGHSFGGQAAVITAQALSQSNRKVALLVLLDGSEPSVPGGTALQARPITQPIPANVKRAVCWCLQQTPILSVYQCPRINWGFATEFVLAGNPAGADHLNIDDLPAVRQRIVEEATR